MQYVLLRLEQIDEGRSSGAGLTGIKGGYCKFVELGMMKVGAKFTGIDPMQYVLLRLEQIDEGRSSGAV